MGMLSLEVRDNVIFFVSDDPKAILRGIEFLAKEHHKVKNDKMQVTILEPNFKGK